MYALGSLGRRSSAGVIAVLRALQGVRCTLWGRVVAALPVCFAWRGLDVGPERRRSPAGVICVAGAVCSPRGWVYALGSLGRHSPAGMHTLCFQWHLSWKLFEQYLQCWTVPKKFNMNHLASLLSAKKVSTYCKNGNVFCTASEALCACYLC